MANIQQNTIIDGAVITPEIIQAIKALQEDDNALIQNEINCLANALAHVAITVYSDDFKIENTKAILYDLSFLRDFITKFKKP